MISLKEKRNINKIFRQKDESHLWPICNRFNVTERAIRQARKLMACNGEFTSDYEYRLTLEHICSTIVNDPKNH